MFRPSLTSAWWWAWSSTNRWLKLRSTRTVRTSTTWLALMNPLLVWFSTLTVFLSSADECSCHPATPQEWAQVFVEDDGELDQRWSLSRSTEIMVKFPNETTAITEWGLKLIVSMNMDVECIPDDSSIQSVSIVQVCMEKANVERVPKLLTDGRPFQRWYNDISMVNKSSTVLRGKKKKKRVHTAKSSLRPNMSAQLSSSVSSCQHQNENWCNTTWWNWICCREGCYAMNQLHGPSLWWTWFKLTGHVTLTTPIHLEKLSVPALCCPATSW